MIKEFKHGIGGYQKHGCRCDVCRKAKSEHGKRYKRKTKFDESTKSVSIRLDATPLIEKLKSSGQIEFVDGKIISRWEKKGIDLYWADKWSLKFGWHPVEIFGKDFYQGV